MTLMNAFGFYMGSALGFALARASIKGDRDETETETETEI